MMVTVRRKAIVSMPSGTRAADDKIRLRVRSMPTKFDDLLTSLDFASTDGGGRNEAFLCRETGKIYWRSPDLDEIEEVPDDVEDDEKYIPIPDKKELDLGKPL